ncbi:sigma-70 family RNA polymerase sigma factor [Paenibacillus senegalensis]|uniref:sigma-70 family RNA polymerase sigma factor n=1 Tax=Paenibacillus senegalensis TaxID=1465766 RepID=UPI0002882CE6|nr:sigma-70 family RNA polymerase sigma factor [Paenibacillus senegalensis]
MKTWIETLTDEYSETNRELKRYRESLDRTDEAGRDEFTVVGGMINDMDFALQWMRNGRRPGNRRGIERQSVYQRTALLDPDIFPSLDLETPEKPLDDRDKRKLVDMLWNLSARERQCYLLHMSYGMSYAEIARELALSRRTVQQYVERAKEKIKNSAA